MSKYGDRIRIIIVATALAWYACAKNDEQNEATTAAQTTMPTLNLSCNSGSCIQ